MRIELTFSSGKFIAYPDVIEESVKKHDDGKTLYFEVRHPKYEKEAITVFVDKLDFLEILDGKKTE